jgi:hypothetical protein
VVVLDAPGLAFEWLQAGIDPVEKRIDEHHDDVEQ